MIEIQPIQITPAAVKARLHSFSGSFPITDDTTIVNIALTDEDDNVLRVQQVNLTQNEYNAWGEGEEGDNAILALCLQKLGIEINE